MSFEQEPLIANCTSRQLLSKVLVGTTQELLQALETITSSERTVLRHGKLVKVKIWNATVANLTLLALGCKRLGPTIGERDLAAGALKTIHSISVHHSLQSRSPETTVDDEGDGHSCDVQSFIQEGERTCAQL